MGINRNEGETNSTIECLPNKVKAGEGLTTLEVFDILEGRRTKKMRLCTNTDCVWRRGPRKTEATEVEMNSTGQITGCHFVEQVRSGKKGADISYQPRTNGQLSTYTDVPEETERRNNRRNRGYDDNDNFWPRGGVGIISF